MFKNLFQISNFKFQIKKGFTLLEMLVVIGMIAILVSMGFASYSTAQKKARDAKRQSDLRSFQAALEQCYSVSSYVYPTINGNNLTSINFNCAADTSLSSTITDPTTKLYTVVQNTNAGTYTVSLPLELGTGAITSISQQQ